jgi:LPXTG-site transpeptidase (sortase) family protein
MNIWRDITHPKKHHHLHVPHEIFDTTEDVLDWVEHTEKKFQKKHHWFKGVRPLFHFILLTTILFSGLLLVSNWWAYMAFARAMIAPEKLIETQKSIEWSLNQIQVLNSAPEEEPSDSARNIRQQKIIKRQLAQKQITTQEIGLSYFDQDISHVSLSLEITPYEDRILIPKIGKNIPLVNVEHFDATNSEEWHKIFMRELEKGIIKYPGSADPGAEGNSFIFWHSSNYPWAKWDYNNVFALLNELNAWDEIIVFFKQKKYVYVVCEKNIVKPWHVSSLGDIPNKKQLTLMTCWPLGTTLNRLLVITELKSTSSSLIK